jgi:hypothetical protein
MTQSTPTIGSGKSGLQYRTEDNDGKKALLNHHKGATAPTYAEAGMVWMDDAATPWIMKVYDGSNWINIGDVHATNNTFTPYNGTLQIDKTDFSISKTGAPVIAIQSTDTTTGDKGSLKLVSKNASSADKTLAEIMVNSATATAAAEDGVLKIKTMRAGTAADRLKIGTGVYTPNAVDNGADSVTAGALYADRFKSLTVTIANNAAYSFTPAVNTGFMFMVGVGISATYATTVVYSLGGGTSMAGAYVSVPFDVNTTTGTLTGTTGTSGRLTSRACQADGKIYIENRIGATQTLNITMIG